MKSWTPDLVWGDKGANIYWGQIQIGRPCKTPATLMNAGDVG